MFVGSRMQKLLRYLRHVIALLLVGFFVASFFVGSYFNPQFVEIARSPYGLFAYFIITAAAVFVPSFLTIPAVVTATIIWGPWTAALVALLGWTTAGVIEYSAGYFAKDTIMKIMGSAAQNKIDRVRGSITFVQFVLARTIVPSFIFGITRAKFWWFVLATIIVFIPWAIVGTLGGTLLRPYYAEARPLLLGLALLLLAVLLDLLFSKQKKV